MDPAQARDGTTKQPRDACDESLVGFWEHCSGLDFYALKASFCIIWLCLVQAPWACLKMDTLLFEDQVLYS